MASINSREITASLLVAFAFCLAITVGLWWLYFDRTAEWAAQQLREVDVPVLTAADAFSYLHLLLVTGVVILAVGEKTAVAAADESLPIAGRVTICAGVALYVVGYDACKWRLGGRPSGVDGVAVAVLLGLGLVTASIPAWGVVGLIAVTVLALCATRTAAGVRMDREDAVVARGSG